MTDVPENSTPLKGVSENLAAEKRAPHQKTQLPSVALFLRDAKNWRCECGAVGDAVSAEWRFNGSGWEHSHGQPIRHVAATRQGDAREIVLRLIDGIERWASDEDGVHSDCWLAYCEAKSFVGQFDWKEEA